MITISLCMIVKNEESVLARCLRCAAQIADEIIIVDTGSTDATKQIAREFTPHIYDFPWQDDFSAVRNFSFSKATREYIMWLNADDIIDEENIRLLQELKETLDPSVDAVMMRYNADFDSRGLPAFTYFRERLLRRDKGYLWQEPVHEYINIRGNIRQYEIAVNHGKKEHPHSTCNLDIYEKRITGGQPLSPRATYYYARELRTHGQSEEAIRYYRKFLNLPGICREEAVWASADLSDCLLRTGQEEAALDALFLSFNRDLPRAEILCRIGAIYFDRQDREKAIFWYEFALEVPRPKGWGFQSEAYWGYIPHMRLCELYDHIHNWDEAIRHHKAAKAIQPDHPAVLYKEAYFCCKAS